MMVIGIDPDSKAHGVAIYVDEKLKGLASMDLPAIIHYCTGQIKGERVIFSIENVLLNNFVYTRNEQKSKEAHAKVALSIGRCQQAQQELMRLLDYLEIEYVLHKPQKGNWAKNKAQFEKITGWTGRSNEDTRSAAYFGYLEARK